MPPQESASQNQRQFDKQALLRSHELFRKLPAAALSRLAGRARIVNYTSGGTIFTRGDQGHGLVAVISGTVKICITSEEGRELVLSVFGPGQIFGEIALFDGLPRTADAIAISDSQVLFLDRTDFIELLIDQPQVGIHVLEVLSTRLRGATIQVESLSFEPPAIRLARTLFQLAEVQARITSDHTVVTITQSDLGAAAGLSRESTNKHLMAWQRAGLVRVAKGQCVLLKPRIDWPL